MTATLDQLVIGMLAGDGIAPELVSATNTNLDTFAELPGVDISYKTSQIVLGALDKHGTTLPAQVLEGLRGTDGIILDPVSHNDCPTRDRGELKPSGNPRKSLDLFANIRPAQARHNFEFKSGTAFDLIIIRENTEGFHANRSMFLGTAEWMPTPDGALAMRKITRQANMRIAKEAFALAQARKRDRTGVSRVTAVHKANVMRTTDVLFLECTREVARRLPEIAYDEILVDAMCSHLVRNPAPLDVVCTTNMLGDILSDLASELAGGLGLASSLNAKRSHATAQAQRGSARDIAGQGVANPSSLIGSNAMLVDWIGQRRSSDKLILMAFAMEGALNAALSDPSMRTVDRGGSLSTSEFTATASEKVAA